jgi:hypothetical protein
MLLGEDEDVSGAQDAQNAFNAVEAHAAPAWLRIIVTSSDEVEWQVR